MSNEPNQNEMAWFSSFFQFNSGMTCLVYSYMASMISQKLKNLTFEKQRTN